MRGLLVVLSRLGSHYIILLRYCMKNLESQYDILSYNHYVNFSYTKGVYCTLI